MAAARLDVIRQVRAALVDAADPAAAPAMQAYMKSELPYYGVRVPVVRKVVRPIIAAAGIADRSEWEATVRAMYDGATHREERYAALVLLGARRYGSFLDAASMPLCEHLIVVGAWWDLVDETAHRVGDALRRDRAAVTRALDGWIRSPSLWLRRAVIICQVGHKADTDLDLLARATAANLRDRDFFIRKAIGWALRDLSTTNPDWVRAYIQHHRAELAPLSVREALRRIGE